MDSIARVSFGSRIRTAGSRAWRALWPYVRTAWRWLVAVELAPLVYLLYIIACGARALRNREAWIAKAFLRIAMFCAAALVVICTKIEKHAGTAGCWLSKKAGLPYSKKTETVSRGENPSTIGG